MKIGFLIEYFHPIVGGAENNCFYLARELAKKHEVHVFTSGNKEEIVDGIHVHRYKNWIKYKYYLTFTPGFLNILKYDLDVLHVHSFGFLWHDFIVLIRKMFSKTKIVNTPHGPFMALNKYGFFENIFRNVVVFKERFLNNLYDVVIQVNPTQYKWIVKYGVHKNKIKYIPNGVPKEIFDKVDSKYFVKKYNLKNKFVISYLGRIQEYKGLDQVIKVLPNLDKKIVFMIMGKDAGGKNKLAKLAKNLNVRDRVIFTKVSDTEKLIGLDVSEVFTLPSEWEAFGIVILEAMARGNAIISTKTEGGEFLVKKENGFVYDFGDLKRLEESINVLFKNKQLREKIKKNNMKKAKEFLWENIAKDLEERYLESYKQETSVVCC
jgi:glycosyltransferase involved in cell wall biosynthesis